MIATPDTSERASSQSTAATTPSIVGDFVLGWGPGTSEWIHSLEGFSPLPTSSDEPVSVGTRGSAQTGRGEDGTRWLAMADLVEGRLDHGIRALTMPDRTPPQRDWRGRFTQVIWNPRDRSLAALTDHYASLPIYTLVQGDVFLIATDLRVLARSKWCRREIDLESVYHYMNFACFPSPGTILRDIRRINPATRVRRVEGKSPVEDRYFVPEYPEDLRGSDASLARELRDRVVETVRDYRPEATSGWGCFLSGGTDSSAVVSILARQNRPGGVKSFSIGFAEAGYDELEFARIAARACGAEPYTANVSKEQAQTLATRVIEEYDQPFANSSAVPTLACADLARDNGISMLLAGDGGDEIFGGNERYAKDKIMSTYFALPSAVKAAGGLVAKAVSGRSSHFLNRVENFFERASLPNPDRFYTDDSFASDHYTELLCPEFRAQVDRDASLDFMRGLYRTGETGGPLHRIMRLDLHMAIARNDIPKVHGATRSANVTTRFPLLDPKLVAFTGHLSERQKVRGIKKRYLFKRAMKGILPEEILKKKKQGFGLPIAVWLRHDKDFQQNVRDVLFDGRAARRGWWQPSFVESLLAEHIRGSWDRAPELWRLFILELWLRRYIDAS